MTRKLTKELASICCSANICFIKKWARYYLPGRHIAQAVYIKVSDAINSANYARVKAADVFKFRYRPSPMCSQRLIEPLKTINY